MQAVRQRPQGRSPVTTRPLQKSKPRKPPPEYEIEFFRRPDGSEPLRRFIDSLSDDKRNALLAALAHGLARQGLGVCGSEWSKQLGGGLAELRLRHDEREVLV